MFRTFTCPSSGVLIHRWTCKCPKHVEAIYENKIIIKLFASSWYIFLTYIYDARSHLHQILYCSELLVPTIHLAVLTVRPLVLRPSCVPEKVGVNKK